MEPRIRHYFPNCNETAIYKSGECKKCKNAKNREYAKSEQGKLVMEKCVTKQRIIRKLQKLGEISSALEKDLATLNIEDTIAEQNLERIQNIMQQLCIQK